MRALLLTFLCLSVVSARAASQAPQLEVSVDPRMELLCAAMTQGDWADSINTFFSPYAQDAQKILFKYRDHEAVKRLDALHKSDVQLADLLAWSTYYSPPPELKPTREMPAALVKALGGRQEVDGLAADLRKLAEASHFSEFTEGHSTFYDLLASDVKNKLPSDRSFSQLEKYLGGKYSKVTVFVAPLIGKPVSGWITTDAGGPQPFLVITPSVYKDNELVLDSAQIHIAAYEGFARAFAEPAIDALPARRDKHAGWYAYMASSLRGHDIPGWSEALTHLFADTVAIRVAESSGDESAANRLRAEAKASGLATLLPFTLERIKEYEAARDKYPAFPSFAGRLFDMLDDLEPLLSGGPPADLGLADVWLTDDGVPIKQITPGSLAAKAGMKAGDTVQSIAGIRINGSESYLKAWHKWEAAGDGEVVPFRIKRGKNSSLISVTMKRAGGFRGFRKKAGK